MFRNLSTGLLVVAVAGGIAQAQPERRSLIDVQQYTINAEVQPRTQSLSATVAVRFVPLQDNTNSATFELNNALNVSRVVDEGGKQVQASRNQQDFTVRLTFDQPLPKGKPATVTFTYDGHLSGNEDSPVYGIKFAAIHEDYAFLLYPARWFPVSGYTTDRFAAEMNITVPTGFKVVAPGIELAQPSADKTVYNFKFDHPSFPASIAVVKGDPVRVTSEGVTTALYFRGAEQGMAQQYGDEIGKQMVFFSGILGVPQYANLTVVETETGAENGYAAPGIIFLSPGGIGRQVNSKLLANKISRQWFEVLVSPATRNHMWLTNGAATYAELLWTEHTAGASALQTAFHNLCVDSLTVDNVPIMQSSRLDDYSPEYWALTGSKGAAVMGMLRYLVGDQNFSNILKEYVKRFSWKSATTEDFKNVAQDVSKQDLGYFFIEWIESSGAPEFKLEYTIFRTQKGFRVMGKVSQDMDTFRMPVDLKVETEGNPQEQRVEVVGTSSEFTVDTFGKPKNSITIDPNDRVLRYSPQMRVAVAIRRGEQFQELAEFGDALKEYQKALESNRNSSMAHFRIAEVFFLQNNYQAAANSFREALNGDLEPKWTECWSHVKLGNIFDITGQRDRAVNEYNLGIRTKDNTQGCQDEAAKYLKAPYERQKKLE